MLAPLVQLKEGVKPTTPILHQKEAELTSTRQLFEGAMSKAPLQLKGGLSPRLSTPLLQIHDWSGPFSFLPHQAEVKPRPPLQLQEGRTHAPY